MSCSSSICFSIEKEDNNNGHLYYNTEMTVSGKIGQAVPFYSVSNRYGALTIGNALYLRGAVNYSNSYKDIDFNVGTDLIVTTAHNHYYPHNYYLQQLYATASYRGFELLIGQKEEPQHLLNNELSSGNILYSNNARPLPKIQFSTPDFLSVPFTDDWLNIKFDISCGIFLDNDYTNALASKFNNYVYIENALIHRKSLFFRSKESAAVVFTMGGEHYGLFGGKGYNKTFSNLMDVFVNKKFDETGTYYLQYAYAFTYDFRVDFNMKSFSLGAYTQNYLEYNTPKGIFSTDYLCGIEFNNKDRHSIIKDCVAEFLMFSNQAYTVFHGTYYQDEPFGAWANYGMSNGTPLCISPIYNRDGNPAYTKTLNRAFHVAVSGQILDQIEYKVKAMYLKSWGANFRYLPEAAHNISINAELDYHLTANDHLLSDYIPLSDIHLIPSLGFDFGGVIGNNFGGFITIRKVGDFNFK